MKTTWMAMAAAGLMIGAAPPLELAAQRGPGRAGQEQRERAQEQRQRAQQQREREQQRNERRDDRQQRDARAWDLPQQQGRGNGPAFCRSGEGHPVFGRQWCREKGFGPGSVFGTGDRRDRDIWGDIILGQPRDRRYDQTIERSVLGDILGAVVLGRFESFGRQHGSGAINGRWIPDARGSVLQLQLGNTPIARLVDTNRDGRVDSVLLRR